MEEVKKQIYQVYRVDPKCLNGLEKAHAMKFKSFMPTILDSFNEYSCEYGTIYEFLGISFLLYPNTSSKLKDGGYTNLYLNVIRSSEHLNDNDISVSIRESGTLPIKEGDNLFITGKKNRIVFDPSGICVCPNSPNGSTTKSDALESDFRKALRCYLLALAYDQKSRDLLLSAISAFDSGDNSRMIEARNDIYAFDMKYFFANPVDVKVYETYKLWKLAEKTWVVKSKHDEIKEQVAELATIIEERAWRKKEWLLAVLGALIAVASLVSVINDGKQLFGL